MACPAESELKVLLQDHMQKSQARHDDMVDWKMGIEHRLSATAVTEHRLNAVEKAIEKMAVSVTTLSESMISLAKVETTQADIQDSLERSSKTVERAFKAIEQGDKEIKELIKDHETRLRVVENDMPTVRLARNWAFSGIVAVITAVGSAILMLVLK